MRVSILILLMLSILPFTAKAASKGSATVYFKDGSVERGELVWVSDDKVSLRKNGELWEFEKNEVILDKTIEKNKLSEMVVMPERPNPPIRKVKKQVDNAGRMAFKQKPSESKQNRVNEPIKTDNETSQRNKTEIIKYHEITISIKNGACVSNTAGLYDLRDAYSKGDNNSNSLSKDIEVLRSLTRKCTVKNMFTEMELPDALSSKIRARAVFESPAPDHSHINDNSYSEADVRRNYKALKKVERELNASGQDGEALIWGKNK